jgi:hypothetical protein
MVLLVGVSGGLLQAQNGAAGTTAAPAAAGPVEDVHGDKVREIHPVAMPTPFALDADVGKTVPALAFRAPEAMTAADRTLVEANETEIARRAELLGFRLDATGSEARGDGGWGYEQAVCPVFPEHVVLEYSRMNGAGDVSLFSAVIPRGEGHVRVIPARRRSYSLFTPAPSNALTLNDFNHIVKEEPAGLSPDWLTLGLCYSALASGHVRAALQAVRPEDEVYPLFLPAIVRVSKKGGAEAMKWELKFAQNGRLLKVRYKDSKGLAEKPVVQTATEVPGKPTNQVVMDVTGGTPVHP